MTGRTLGHHRLVERIGAGGMSEVHRARDLPGARYVSRCHRAQVALGLRRTGVALVHLDRAFEDRTPLLVVLRAEPRLDPIRTHSRFESLLACLEGVR